MFDEQHCACVCSVIMEWHGPDSLILIKIQDAFAKFMVQAVGTPKCMVWSA